MLLPLCTSARTGRGCRGAGESDDGTRGGRRARGALRGEGGGGGGRRAGGALRVEVGEVAALLAGARVEHAVDEGRDSRVECRPEGRLQLLGGGGAVAGSAERLDEALLV